MTLLSKIKTDTKRFQFRDTPFSERTVKAIVADGLDLARFDPIPIIQRNGHAIVAGDGHSRLEAIHRLAKAQGLPSQWKAGRGDWEIPTRPVPEDAVLRLAYVANMSRSPFTACEEAKIFQARCDAGESTDDIAKTSHVSKGYVTKRLRLNCLSKTIREAVGQPWGIDTDKAIVLAEIFERYEVKRQVQQQLWLNVICKGDWTPHSLKLFTERICKRLTATGSSSASMLFELPPNIDQTVQEMTTASKCRREAYRMLVRLMRYRDALDGIDLAKRLLDLLNNEGEKIVDALRETQDEDAAIMEAMLL